MLNVASNDAAIERAKELQSQHGIRASAYKVDGMVCSSFVLPITVINTITVSNVDQVQKTMSQTEKDFNKIDVFVANAGSESAPSTPSNRSTNIVSRNGNFEAYS